MNLPMKSLELISGSAEAGPAQFICPVLENPHLERLLSALLELQARSSREQSIYSTAIGSVVSGRPPSHVPKFIHLFFISYLQMALPRPGPDEHQLTTIGMDHGVSQDNLCWLFISLNTK